MPRHSVNTAVAIARVLSNHGMKGYTLSDTVVDILDAIPATEVPPCAQPHQSALADWEKELLRGDIVGTPESWCAQNLDNYRTPDGGFRKINMIKDLRDWSEGRGFGDPSSTSDYLSLKAAKDFVDDAVQEDALTKLRQKLTGN